MKETLDNFRQSDCFRLSISKIALTSFLLFLFSSVIFCQNKTTLSGGFPGSQVMQENGSGTFAIEKI